MFKTVLQVQYILVYTDRQKLKQSKPVTRKVRSWNRDNLESLRYCFETTDWDVLLAEDSIDDSVNVITDYIKFCEDLIVPEKNY